MPGGLQWMMFDNASRATQALPSFAATVLATSPTAWWRMNETSGNLADSSGNGRTLTASGITYQVSGATADGDKAISMSGTNYIRAADAAWMDIGTNDFSIMWAQNVSSTWASLARQIMGHDGQGNLGQFAVRMRASGISDLEVVLYDATSGTLTARINNCSAICADAWVLCILTVDRDGNATLYADGNTIGSVSVATASAYNLTNAMYLYVGCRNTTGDYTINGGLDEVALWNGTLLTTQQRSDIFAAKSRS